MYLLVCNLYTSKNQMFLKEINNYTIITVITAIITISTIITITTAIIITI